MKNPISLPFTSTHLLSMGTLFVFLIGGLVGCSEFQAGPTEPDVAMEGYDLTMELPAAAKTGLDSDVFVVVEQAPTLIGGLTGLQSKIQYPEIAKRAGVEGRVFLQFVVEADGRVRDVVITRGIGAGADEEAMRVVQNAKFIPGVQDGMRVPVKMSLPVTFRLGLDGEPDLNPNANRPVVKANPGETILFVDPKTVVIYESFKDVNFEYDVVMMAVMGDQAGKGATEFDEKSFASKTGSTAVVRGGPQNEGVYTEGPLKTHATNPAARFAISPKK